jgi:hypothetical protein
MYRSSSAHPRLSRQTSRVLDHLLDYGRMRLGTGLAFHLDLIFRDAIVENGERAAVGGAACHGGSAYEIVVNRGPVVEIQPVQLFRGHSSVIV